MLDDCALIHARDFQSCGSRATDNWALKASSSASRSGVTARLSFSTRRIYVVALDADTEVPADQIRGRTENVEPAAGGWGEQGCAVPFSRADVVGVHGECDDFETGGVRALEDC